MFPHEKDSAKYEESKTGRSMEEEERNTFYKASIYGTSSNLATYNP